jgi:putative DNA primase/helicase
MAEAKRGPIDFVALAQALLGAARSFLDEWFPGGRIEGHEWLGPRKSEGGIGDSLKVNLHTGRWAYFGGGDADAGIDLVSLYAWDRGLNNGQAARELMERLGWTRPEQGQSQTPQREKPTAQPRQEKTPRWQCMPGPAPVHAAPPKSFVWRYHDRVRNTWIELEAVRVWEYRRDNERWGYVGRFERVTSQGEIVKETLPLSWCQDREDALGACSWHWKQWTAPRPLYLARGTMQTPRPAVLVVEGEKCADAAHALIGETHDVVCWPGGAKAWQLADWSWIAGRDVVLWPDADMARVRLTRAEREAGVDPASKPLLPLAEQPGQRAMLGIAKHLFAEHGCTVAVVPLPAPGVLPAGWDVADAIAAGQGVDAVRRTVATAVPAGDTSKPEPTPANPQQKRALAGGRSTPPTGSAAGKITRAPTDAPQAEADGGGGGGDGGDGEAPPPAPAGRRGRKGEPWRKLLLGDAGTKDCRENVYLQLVHNPALQGLVGYDEFAHQVLKLRTPPWDSPTGEWTTNDDYYLAYWLAQHEQMVVKGEGTVISGVAMAAFAARFHPVKRYLEGLPAWDGVPRLRHWLHECLGAADTEYTALVGSWVVMSMCRRIQHPGCQNDYMIVLEGLQGKRKSTALRTLAVREEWFADTPVRIGTPDALLTIAGKWVYEIAEMDSFNRAEATAVKSYITSRSDRVREPYARRFADRPRSGVFVGSTNQAEYFKDPTGARRFWPVACDGSIDIAKLEEWREQLFAEALQRLASKDPEEARCWPTRAEEERYLTPEQEQREIQDPWADRLAQWLNSPAKFGDGMQEVCEVESFTSFDLLTKGLAVPMDRIDGGRQMATRVGTVMHRLGWSKRRDSKGARVWRYWRPSAATDAAERRVAQPGGPGDDDHAAHQGEGDGLDEF